MENQEEKRSEVRERKELVSEANEGATKKARSSTTIATATTTNFSNVPPPAQRFNEVQNAALENNSQVENATHQEEEASRGPKNKFDAAWEEKFQLLCNFYQTHGHVSVPKDGSELANWVTNQKSRLGPNNRGNDPSVKSMERIQKLEQVNFWEPTVMGINDRNNETVFEGEEETRIAYGARTVVGQEERVTKVTDFSSVPVPPLGKTDKEHKAGRFASNVTQQYDAKVRELEETTLLRFSKLNDTCFYPNAREGCPTVCTAMFILNECSEQDVKGGGQNRRDQKRSVPTLLVVSRNQAMLRKIGKAYQATLLSSHPKGINATLVYADTDDQQLSSSVQKVVNAKKLARSNSWHSGGPSTLSIPTTVAPHHQVDCATHGPWTRSANGTKQVIGKPEPSAVGPIHTGVMGHALSPPSRSEKDHKAGCFAMTLVQQYDARVRDIEESTVHRFAKFVDTCFFPNAPEGTPAVYSALFVLNEVGEQDIKGGGQNRLNQSRPLPTLTVYGRNKFALDRIMEAYQRVLDGFVLPPIDMNSTLVYADGQDGKLSTSVQTFLSKKKQARRGIT